MDRISDKKGKNPSADGQASGQEDDAFLEDMGDEDLDDSSWDEEGDSGESDGGDFSEPAPKKKKGFLSFNTIVIALAVVFGGGFVLMQMSKRGTALQSAQVVAPVSRLQMSGMTDNPVFKDVRKEEPQRLPQTDSETPLPEPVPELPPPGIMGDDAQAPIPQPSEPSSEPVKKADTLLPRPPSGDVLTPLPPLPAPVGGEAGQPVASSQPPVAEDTDPLAPFRKKKAAVGSTSEAEGKVPLDTGKGAKDLSVPKAGAVPAVPVEDVVKSDLPGLPPPGVMAPATDLPPVAEGGASGAIPEKTQTGSSAGGIPAPQPQASTVSGEDLVGVRKSLAGLEDRLSSIESRLEAVSKQAQVASTPDGARDSEISALKESIARLQKDLAAREDQATARSVKDLEQTARSEEAPRKASSKATTKRTDARAPSRSTKPAEDTRRPSKASSAPRWEIRAIQPGVAWVAPPGEDDMQSIAVGDNLPGLGVIRSISVVDGAWVIEGTKGRLRQ